MSKETITIYYCDLCKMDGEEKIDAVAKYIAGDGIEYAVCNKHLKHVKENNLKFWLLN